MALNAAVCGGVVDGVNIKNHKKSFREGDYPRSEFCVDILWECLFVPLFFLFFYICLAIFWISL